MGLDLPLWDMTADEISDALSAARARNTESLARLYKAGEALAYNTAALCLTAFNAPHRFPKSMSDAFIRAGGSCGAEEFAAVAEQINRMIEKKVITNDS